MKKLNEKEKFSSQANSKLLKEVRQLAQDEGRQFQNLLEEALKLLIESRNSQNPRGHVMAHFKASLRRHKKLAELLAT
jgi:hypothetical protein